MVSKHLGRLGDVDYRQAIDLRRPARPAGRCDPRGVTPECCVQDEVEHQSHANPAIDFILLISALDPDPSPFAEARFVLRMSDSGACLHLEGRSGRKVVAGRWFIGGLSIIDAPGVFADHPGTRGG